MNELVLELKQISPKEFFGPQNKNIELVKQFFPELKIIARGYKITAFGDEIKLKEFDKRMDILFQQFGIYNTIDENIIERVLSSSSKDEYSGSSDDFKIILHGVGGRIIKAKTANQRKLIDMVCENDMVFAIGPAGTGKTYTGVALAVKALKEKKVKRIILTRPAVEAGENLGFLPGNLNEKLDPYMQPLYDALREMIPSQKLNNFIDKGIIQIAPLGFMRGRTLDNAFVILDEGQNTTNAQMKMFLTRMGKNAKFLITGDPGQIDLPTKAVSGLNESLKILKDINGIGLIELDERDVIRHSLVKKIIDAYNNNNK